LVATFGAGMSASFPVVRTQADGTQSLTLVREPFRQSGPILSADAELVTQAIRGRETFTYSTKDLLRCAQDRDAALRDLELAASKHQNVTLHVAAEGLHVTAPVMTLQRGHDAHGR
jgi:hypothetical protein